MRNKIAIMRYEVKITRYKYTIRKNKVANKRKSQLQNILAEK